jgi:hypothetical protein
MCVWANQSVCRPPYIGHRDHARGNHLLLSIFLWHWSLMRPGAQRPTLYWEKQQRWLCPLGKRWEWECIKSYQGRSLATRVGHHSTGRPCPATPAIVAWPPRESAGSPPRVFAWPYTQISPTPLVSGQAAGGERPVDLHRLDGDSTLNLRRGECRWPDLSTTAAGYPASVAPSFLAR